MDPAAPRWCPSALAAASRSSSPKGSANEAVGPPLASSDAQLEQTGSAPPRAPGARPAEGRGKGGGGPAAGEQRRAIGADRLVPPLHVLQGGLEAVAGGDELAEAQPVVRYQHRRAVVERVHAKPEPLEP